MTMTRAYPNTSKLRHIHMSYMVMLHPLKPPDQQKSYNQFFQRKIRFLENWGGKRWSLASLIMLSLKGKKPKKLRG